MRDQRPGTRRGALTLVFVVCIAASWTLGACIIGPKHDEPAGTAGRGEGAVDSGTKDDRANDAGFAHDATSDTAQGDGAALDGDAPDARDAPDAPDGMDAPDATDATDATDAADVTDAKDAADGKVSGG